MEITELWREHSHARFPKGYGGRDVNGVCVTSVDTYITGCISSYMKNNQRNINAERYQVLQKYKCEIEYFLPYLGGEAFEYFSRLHEMFSIIIVESRIKKYDEI